MLSISIIVPVYNEENSVIKILKLVKEKINELKKFNFEIIVINDGSDDNTKKNLEDNNFLYDQLINNNQNYGKGFSIRRGIEKAKNDIILIQDADLEYLPENYEKLLRPFEYFEADIVYGSRFKSTEIGRVLLFWHSLANKIITLISNIFSDLNLSDVEVGYKVFKRDIVKNIFLVENSFGFEIEITHKLSNQNKNLKFFEVGISYCGRTYAEGKKIGIKDAFRALYCILKYGFFKIK